MSKNHSNKGKKATVSGAGKNSGPSLTVVGKMELKDEKSPSSKNRTKRKKQQPMRDPEIDKARERARLIYEVDDLRGLEQMLKANGISLKMGLNALGRYEGMQDVQFAARAIELAGAQIAANRIKMLHCILDIAAEMVLPKEALAAHEQGFNSFKDLAKGSKSKRPLIPNLVLKGTKWNHGGTPKLIHDKVILREAFGLYASDPVYAQIGFSNTRVVFGGRKAQNVTGLFAEESVAA